MKLSVTKSRSVKSTTLSIHFFDENSFTKEATKKTKKENNARKTESETTEVIKENKQRSKQNEKKDRLPKRHRLTVSTYRLLHQLPCSTS